MSPKAVVLIRRIVSAWIIPPAMISLLTVVAADGFGRVVGAHAVGAVVSVGYGLAFLAFIVPTLSAHIVMVASLLGLVGLATGVQADLKYLVTIGLGLFVSSVFLFRLYV